MKKAWIWFYMLTKRLFRKYSFLIILLLIPLAIPLVNVAMQSESGMLRIAVCNAGTDSNAEKIVEDLLSSKSVLLYKRYNTPEEARKAVETGAVDGAWIFEKEFSKRAEIHAKENKGVTMVTVLERESTIPLQMAREKLYGAMYPHISRLLYIDFMEKEFSSNLSEEQLLQYYETSVGGDDVIRLESLQAEVKNTKENYLTAPIRGLLALMIVLCGLAASCYFLQDTKAGKYDWLSPRKRILPAFGTSFAAVMASGAAVFLALHLAGLDVGFGREFLAMFLYILATTGFCAFFSLVFRDAGHLGACIPFFIIGMLALSPVFFDVQEFKYISLLLPSWHYLRAIHDTMCLIHMFFYCVAVLGLTVVVNYLQYRKG